MTIIKSDGCFIPTMSKTFLFAKEEPQQQYDQNPASSTQHNSANHMDKMPTTYSTESRAIHSYLSDREDRGHLPRENGGS